MRPSRSRPLALLTAAVLAVTGGVLTAAPAAAHDHREHRKNPAIDATLNPIGEVAATAPGAALGRPFTFRAVAKGKPSVTSFTAKLTRNPDTALLYEPGFTTPDDACEAPVCRELVVKVPEGSQQTLYARAGWPSVTQYVHLWGISPSGKVVGQANVARQVDKTVGNAGVAPLAQFTVPNPEPGTWRIQVRAVYGVDIPVTGYAALSKGKALVFPRLDVKQLADKHLTQRLTFNIVFVNRQWSKEEIAEFKKHMPLEYRNAVLTKQFADGCGDEESAEGVQNWRVTHYCRNVPYFEPLKYQFDYRYLQADRTWTRDLFAEMKRVTTIDQPFRDDEQSQYLAAYDAHQGKESRGAGAVVTNPTVGDKIDAFAVEDWMFKTRKSAKYARSFRDLETGKSHSARFITPDPGAYYDPFYTRTGRKNLERMPQGPATSISFFVLDTFNGELAAEYFRPNAYHFFDVSKYMVDPDNKVGDGPDYSRVWGGRYRFFVHDLGAGPNYYEAVDFFIGAVPGSAAYPNGDPPIWDYQRMPQWAGKLPERTARDAATMLFGRLTAGYLYRPVPADVYFLASNNWSDCYSNPQCSADGISHTRLEKIFSSSYVEKNLSAALPGVTFTTERSNPRLKTFRYLGCAANRAVANPDPAALNTPRRIVLAPDPNCVGKKSDKFQEALEEAKARGDDLVGVGVNDLGASGNVFRAWVERNRADVAPQPPGQFTLTNVSVVFPGGTTWYLPAIVGGVALGTPNDEGWGILNNVNDRFKYEGATDCAKSKPFAPGCNGVPPARKNGSGFSYTVQHEASHFLGLLHPHDMLTVEKDENGKWERWGDTYRHYADFAMAPTTYAGAFAPYSVIDQDIIQRGHAAEYLRQVQDYLADAYHQDGAKGLTKPSAATAKKVRESAKWRDQASTLFRCGDYLHAERAMRNASLAAQGVYGPVVSPRPLKPGERVLFKVNPQPVFDADGRPKKGCRNGSSTTPAAVTAPGGPGGPSLPSLPAQADAGVLSALVLLMSLLVLRRARAFVPRPA